MSKCLGNMNTFCYICGKFVVSHNRKPLSERVEHAYSFYYSRTIAKRPWTPNICRAICYNGLANWMNGKRASMPFGIPMEWMDPGPVHDSATCCVCVDNASIHNVHQLRQFVYKNVPTATLPRPHSHEVPVPKGQAHQQRKCLQPKTYYQTLHLFQSHPLDRHRGWKLHLEHPFCWTKSIYIRLLVICRYRKRKLNHWRRNCISTICLHQEYL